MMTGTLDDAALGCADTNKLYPRVILHYCPVARRDRINDLLVESPDSVPFQ